MGTHGRAVYAEKGTIFFFPFLSSFWQCINSAECNERSRAAVAYNALWNEKMGKKSTIADLNFNMSALAVSSLSGHARGAAPLFDHAIDRYLSLQ